MNKEISVTTELIPSYAVVHLSGSINTSAEEEIESEIARMIEAKCPVVLLDCTHVEHINSAGITILIGVAARLRDKGMILAAYGLSEHYRRIFQMIGLADYIVLGKDRESLLSQIQQSKKSE